LTVILALVGKFVEINIEILHQYVVHTCASLLCFTNQLHMYAMLLTYLFLMFSSNVNHTRLTFSHIFLRESLWS
jgi:hypothetical protein